MLLLNQQKKIYTYRPGMRIRIIPLQQKERTTNLDDIEIDNFFHTIIEFCKSAATEIIEWLENSAPIFTGIWAVKAVFVAVVVTENYCL